MNCRRALCLAALLACATLAEDLKWPSSPLPVAPGQSAWVSKDSHIYIFPLVKVEGDTYTLKPDLRDIQKGQWWFYFNFRVRGAAGRTFAKWSRILRRRSMSSSVV